MTFVPTIPLDDSPIFPLDRFFTAIRVIDVSHAENLLMFGENIFIYPAHASKRCTLNVYGAVEERAEFTPVSKLSLHY